MSQTLTAKVLIDYRQFLRLKEMARNEHPEKAVVQGNEIQSVDAPIREADQQIVPEQSSKPPGRKIEPILNNIMKKVEKKKHATNTKNVKKKRAAVIIKDKKEEKKKRAVVVNNDKKDWWTI